MNSINYNVEILKGDFGNDLYAPGIRLKSLTIVYWE